MVMMVESAMSRDRLGGIRTATGNLLSWNFITCYPRLPDYDADVARISLFKAAVCHRAHLYEH